MAHFTNDFGQSATVEKNGEYIVIRWETERKDHNIVYPKNGRFYSMRVYYDKHGIEQSRITRTNKREYDMWLKILEADSE